MKRILVVDDAATVRLYHRAILEGCGYQVDEAMNGIEALEKCLEHSFDLYVVDVNMPKMDGYTFIRQLRSLDIPQAPAIMVSTESEQHDMDAAFAAGANLCLHKPSKPDQLRCFVAFLLGEVAL